MSVGIKPVVVLSMLHESASLNSATRRFGGAAVLGHTLRRVWQAGLPAAVVHWSDQSAAVGAVLASLEREGRVIGLDFGGRQVIEALDRLTLARRWSDGWRSPLMQSAAFDCGFHAPAVQRAMDESASDAAILLDPSSGLMDPELLRSLVAQAAAHPDRGFFFLPTPPGFSAALLRAPALRELGGVHPGRSLHYHPDRYGGDPISSPSCAPAPTPVVRSAHRYTLDDSRQLAIAEWAVARAGSASDAGSIVAAFAEVASGFHGDLPRDLRIDLSSRRHTRPVFLPKPAGRTEVAAAEWERVLDELVEPGYTPPAMTSPTRLTLGGLGDPLLHPECLQLVRSAADRGVPACIETDLVGIGADLISELASSSLDLLLVHLPAATRHTYAAIMQADLHDEVLRNMQTFLTARGRRASPVLIPVFTKLSEKSPGGGNLAEMEPWYDHYLRHLGHAVIDGPSTFAGTIPDYSVADMSPSSRKPCRRIASRLTLLSDVTLPCCELSQVPLTSQRVGKSLRLTQAWTGDLEVVRRSHDPPMTGLPAPCSACADWHRP